jgi:hypothetical protein
VSIEFLCWLIGAAALVALWLRHADLSRQAVALARNHVAREGLQFLDQSAVLCRLRLGRGDGGGLHLVRTFRFEFSARGDRRYYGWITLAGSELRHIELQPFREHTLH